MTVAVGVAWDGEVVMALDCLTSWDTVSQLEATKTIRRCQIADGVDMLICAAGRATLTGEMRWSWNPPTLADAGIAAHETPTVGDDDADRWAHAVARSLRSHIMGDEHLWNVVRSEDSRNIEGAFLLGALGRVWDIGCTFSISRTPEEHTAVGSGAEIALGALYVARSLNLSPRAAVGVAMEAAAAHTTTVSRTFSVECIRPSG